MVNLIWKDKRDKITDLENLKITYSNFFKIFETHSIPTNEDNQKKTLKHWKNKLFWGENLEILYYLLNKFENKIDLIYIDPPFFSGTNYEIEVQEESKNYDSIAYQDYWDNDLDKYLQMLYERLILFKRLLSKKGLLFIHSDWHASHYIKLILDEIFGEKRFVNNIVWYYYNKYSAGKRNLPRAHDDILLYAKTSNYTFNELRLPRKKPIKQLKREMVNGVLKNVKDENGHVIYRVVTDKKMDDIWRIPCMQPASREWTGFPTQKHHDLLERIIKLGSNEDDLIADFFCGSGTTLLCAEKLKRRWIGSDISKYSIYITRKRILNYHENQENLKTNALPFEILTHFTQEKENVINSGFFSKEIRLKRT